MVTKRKIAFSIALFLYIYNICFAIVPGSLRTRLIFGCVGIFYFLFRPVPKLLFKISGCWIICLVVGLIVSLFNQIFDFWFFQFIVLNIIYAFGAFLIFKLFPEKINFSINNLLLTIVLCILIHNIIAFAGLFLSPLQGVVNSIQKVNNTDLVAGMMLSKNRALGLGDGNYFFGGVISGIGLIITLYLGQVGFLSKIRSVLFFVVILLTGIFIARTTLIGLVGVLLLIDKNRQQRKDGCIIMLRILLSLIILIFVAITFLSQYLNLEWALEFVFSYLDKGELETASTNDLSTMYIMPKELKTLVVGDAKIVNSDGSYYMHIDAGILRHLYFWGIWGIVTYLWCLSTIYYSIYLEALEKNIGKLIVVLFIYLVILNFKGIVDTSFILYLLGAFFSSHRQKTLNKERQHILLYS